MPEYGHTPEEQHPAIRLLKSDLQTCDFGVRLATTYVAISMLIESHTTRGGRAPFVGRLCQVLLLAIATYFSSDVALLAQISALRTTENLNNPWTATTDVERDNINPTRIIESHSQNENRKIDTQSIQIRGLDGYLVPYQDIEKETLQVDATTVRTTTRTFGRDVNGAKTLVQVTEEEKHTEPTGDSAVVRITSNPDVNGKLQEVQRERVETKRISNDLQETQSTASIPNINGGLGPVLKTDEIARRKGNDTFESQKSTVLLDGNGDWQLNELRQISIRQKGEEPRSEERVSRLDAEGKLRPVSCSVGAQSENTSGERRNTVETYSVDVPGRTPDGSLHLVERTTTTRWTNPPGEQITDTQVEQRDPGNPDVGLRVSVLINDTLQPGPSGEQATYTIQMRDANGNIGVVSVDTTQSDRGPSFQFGQSR